MYATAPTNVTTKGQVTIPKRVRDSLGLAAGSKVSFVTNSNGEYVLKPANKPTNPVRPDRFDRARGILKGGLSTDEVMKLLRPVD